MKRTAEIVLIFATVFALILLVIMYKLNDYRMRLEVLEQCQYVEVELDVINQLDNVKDYVNQNKVKICVYEVGD